MTAKISQQVVHRQRTSQTPFQTRGVRRNSSRSIFHFTSPFQSQRGSVSQGTLTITVGFIAILMVTLLGFFYLQQVIGTASQGTDIHTLESSIVELRDKQRELELEGAELRSLQAIENKMEKLNLVKTEKVTYLAPQAGHVAIAR